MIGDTVEYYLPQNFNVYDISSAANLNLELTNPYSFIVTDVKWDTLFSSEPIRIIQNLPMINVEEECNFMVNIIDGIGSEGGFLGYPCIQATAGFGPYFRGFESESLTYVELEGCTVTSVNAVGQTLISLE